MAGLRPFGLMNALAQTTNDYKALVCIFLFGGNDSNNVLIPFDTAGYANYANLRGPVALAQNSLLQLSNAPDFALHPSLPDVQTLFQNGNAAFVANVGTLIQPLTAATYQAGQVPTPSNLFSHPDQQLEWQNSEQSGGAPTGWAGRIADSITSQYNPGGQIPMVASMDGNALFGSGATSSPLTVSPSGFTTGGCSEGAQCASRQATEQQLITFASGFSLVQQDNLLAASADKYIETIAGYRQSAAALKTVFPSGNPLAAQLQQIAQVIQIRQSLGMGRQIFFAGLGGFDTHTAQLGTQSALLGQLSQAVAAFYAATQELQLVDQITTFTMSDFARAYQPNSNNGTDHGWGGHQFAFGGAVKGGKIYGTYPTIALGGPDDSGVNGRWIPSSPSVQYAATLANWFGVPAADMPTVFPLLGNFGTNSLTFL